MDMIISPNYSKFQFMQPAATPIRFFQHRIANRPAESIEFNGRYWLALGQDK
jgi:hypothetical protein